MGDQIRRSTGGRAIRALTAFCAVALVLASAAEAAFDEVPGHAERSGPGTVYRYVVKVERELQVDPEEFATDVRHVLYDHRGWTQSGRVAFKWVERRADTKIFLAKPNTVDRMCAPLPTNGMYSCRIGERVILNAKRWRHGTTAWPGSRRDYRRMAVNHEVGHRLGQGHRSCGGAGRRAPVMQQQTIDLGGCRANSWPLRREAETLPPPGNRVSAAGAARG
jgi:hypothetical protein